MHAKKHGQPVVNKLFNGEKIPAGEDRWHGFVLGTHCPMLKSKIKAAPRAIMTKCKGDAIVSLPMDWKKTSRANKGATVTSNTTNIAMWTTSWDPKDSFYDGHGAARSLSKCLPLKAGNTIFRNEYWTWPTHGPNNYELMDVVGMLGIVLWSHVTETSFSKRFSFPKRSDRQRQTTREPSKNMLWDPTARGMLKK